jgi:hypothetical protein
MIYVIIILALGGLLFLYRKNIIFCKEIEKLNIIIKNQTLYIIEYKQKNVELEQKYNELVDKIKTELVGKIKAKVGK